MIKNILGALLLGLLLTACGKTPAETTDTTVQDSTAADAEAKRKAEAKAEKERKRAQAEATKKAREQQEKLDRELEFQRLEQERLIEEKRRAQEEADRRTAEIEAAKNAEAKAENIKQFKKALTEIEQLLKGDISLEKVQKLNDAAETILSKIKGLSDEGLIQKASLLVGRLKEMVLAKSPKKGSYKDQALAQLNSDLDRANHGQITFAEILESLENAERNKDDSNFTSVILGLEKVKSGFLEKGKNAVVAYKNELKNLAEKSGNFNPNLNQAEMESAIATTKRADKILEAVNLENFTVLIGDDLANKLLGKIGGTNTEKSSMLDNFLKMLMADIAVDRISEIKDANKIATAINIAVDFISKAKFDDDVKEGLLEDYKAKILASLSGKLKSFKAATGANAKAFLGWPK